MRHNPSQPENVMKKLLIIIVLAILTLIALSPILLAAKPATRGRSSHRTSYRARSTYRLSTSYRPTTMTHRPRTIYAAKSVKFRHGVYYPGKAHYHWTKRYYSYVWGQWFFYSPIDDCWFYWYAASERYYPVAVLNLAPPSTDLLPSPSGKPAGREGSLGDVPAVPGSQGPDLPEPEGE
jgi:hypothetical protein